MQIETNINGDRIAYEYLYEDALDGAEEALNDEEEALYWTATQDAEDAIAKIEQIQSRRRGDDGEIDRVLLADDLRELKSEMNQLNDAITHLLLIDKAVAWTEMRESRLEEILEEQGVADE